MKYLYRAVDKVGKIIDFLLTEKRDKKAAVRFFEKAMQANGITEKITMDKSGANKSAIDLIIDDKGIFVQVPQIKYLINIVEQDCCSRCHFGHGCRESVITPEVATYKPRRVLPFDDAWSVKIGTPGQKGTGVNRIHYFKALTTASNCAWIDLS